MFPLPPANAGVGKLRPVGRIPPADRFNSARQIPCTFFASTMFPIVDSSATALAVACHVNSTVSGFPVARQPRIQPSGQNVWPPLA